MTTFEETSVSETTAAVAAPTASVAAPAAAPSGGRRVALDTARVVLALFFGFSAVAKIMAHESAVQSFDRMGWGSGAMYTIGGLETAGAVALLVPLLAGVAAMALAGLLAGASIVQLTLLDPPNAVMPALLIAVVVLIARDRKDRTAELAALLRGLTAARRGGQ